jgi:PAS domain S-box-containing protein
MAGLLAFLRESGLPPHGFCLLWDPRLIALHVTSDAVIALSYFAIPLALGWFVSKRRDLAFGWVIWLFGAFITLCGTTHLMEIWVLWHADYAVQGLVKAATAAVSLLTAVLLWPLTFRLRTFPTPEQFRAVSDQLATETAERRRAEESLHGSEQQLRVLLDGVNNHAIFMLDTAGMVTSWNAGAARIKGYSAREVVGRHFSLFHTAEDRAAGMPARALRAAETQGRFESEGWRVRRDGSRFWASVVIEALRNPSGALIGYAKITRDITERHQAMLALEQTRAALAQAQKMETVGQLTGGVAHDFNNLLTAIMGGADLLARRIVGLDETSRRVLTGITEAAQRGAALVQRLLAFSRKQALRPEVTDANRLLAGMSELLRRTLGEQIKVETVLAGGLWYTFVDRNQLENAILNLAVNARDAMPGGGRLTLETGNTMLDESYAAANPEATAGQFVLIAVSDTGDGMSAEVRQRAFEPFFTTKAEGAGTGLGLSQVYGFVKQSGGHVKIYSEEGTGTTVKIYLPRRIEADAAGPDDGLRYAAAPGGTETVLVVEDHEDVRVYAAGALAHLGYRVLEAADAASGLKVLAAHTDIALLFTDVGLPGMNGRGLAEAARRKRPGIRVLYTTGYARNAIVHHGILDAGVELLPKPYTVEMLARKLRAVLDAPAGAEAVPQPATAAQDGGGA